ncbi:Ig-like domain-containing protein, partial [Taibaiella helva]|uniref:Ig-like domain-containing protein n=1 Tax=Taibaiella helva TaxID=2301235 RepID=UPI0013008794
TVCETQLPYPWNGQSLTASGTYTHTQPNAVGCDSIVTLTFTVSPQVTPAFAAIAPICSGATAPVLPATSTNGITGTWSPATVSNTATGTYTFTPNAGQCATTATLTVTVNPVPPVPGVSSPVVYCQDAPALALNASGANLLWYTTPSGGTGSPTAPTPPTTTPGATTWYVSQAANGCESSRAAIAVIINATPAAPAVSPVAYCQGEPATALTAGGSNLQWYTIPSGDTGSATAPVPSTASPGTTTWYVSQTVNGCESQRAPLTVDVNPLPVAPDAVSLVEYCEGDLAAALSATGEGLRWYTEAEGGTGAMTGPVPSTTTPGTTTWYVSQTVNGCEGPRTQVVVIVHANPVVDAKLEIVGTTMYLNAQAPGTNLGYAWTPSEGLSCTDCNRPQASPARSTIYTVTVTTSAGCKATDTVGVYLDCNKIYIPNTFSPNGDGNNDRFYPIGLSLKWVKVFRIYNRWGELIYSRDNVPANDPLYGWDGNYQSKAVKPDAFVYYLEATCTSGEDIFRKGDITIIR